MKFLKKITVFGLILGLALMQNFSASAIRIAAGEDISDISVPIDTAVTDAPIGAKLEIKAKSAILMEPYTGEVLYEDNSGERLAPASITKVMSLLLIMEAIEKKELSLEDVISASKHACSMGGSQIWLEENESMTVDELLKAAVIASANDATVALGEAVAGSEEGFVAMMNQKAKQLGMNSTTFKNCTGLDEEGHLTTAYDIAIMSSALIKYPLIKRYSTVWMDSLRNGESELVNTNKLVRFYEGATGLKTGTTSVAGSCLSATANRDGMEQVAVIMGADTSANRFDGAKKLLDFGFSNYKFNKYSPEIPKDTYVVVKSGEEKAVRAACKDTLEFLSKKSESGEITYKISLKENLKAPISKGDEVGSVSVYMNDEEIGTLPLKAKNGVAKMRMKTAVSWLIRSLFKA